MGMGIPRPNFLTLTAPVGLVSAHEKRPGGCPQQSPSCPGGNAHVIPPLLSKQEDKDLELGADRGKHMRWETPRGLSHTGRRVEGASPVQGLLLHDAFKHVLVFLSEAAKLIAGAELVSRGTSELDVEGRGREVNLGDSIREASKENRQVSGGCHLLGSPASFSHASIPAFLPPPLLPRITGLQNNPVKLGAL